eukprot:TRINITY_DN86660_c0_g1_i1.p1 TRINITY_DN86660_c0_g1~~TRINITY_DN86660_c0_g1_i1.p1  ORF type:complete len:199 (+),score=7.21 TRINITY_DN86660_c0_g1_i1:23-598(+)
MSTALQLLVAVAVVVTASASPYQQLLDSTNEFELEWRPELETNTALICFGAIVPNIHHYVALGFKNGTGNEVLPMMAGSDIVAGIGGNCSCVQVRNGIAPTGYPNGGRLLEIHTPSFHYEEKKNTSTVPATNYGRMSVCLSRAIAKPRHGNTNLVNGGVVIWAIGPTGYNDVDVWYHGKTAGNATVNWLGV